MTSGIDKAWQLLSEMNPSDVCFNAGAEYDPARQAYVLKCLGQDFIISPADRTVAPAAAEGDVLVTRLGYFFLHSVLWYLVGAKNAALSGRHIRPSDVKGGHHFFKGTHALPLDAIASKYSSDKEGFLIKCASLGGQPQTFGDASCVLYPMPKIPVTLILWTLDEEFPARVDLLFDSTCELHAPLDIIWSIAMMTALSVA